MGCPPLLVLLAHGIWGHLLLAQRFHGFLFISHQLAVPGYSFLIGGLNAGFEAGAQLLHNRQDVLLPVGAQLFVHSPASGRVAGHGAFVMMPVAARLRMSR
jgi:hypothetical protein